MVENEMICENMCFKKIYIGEKHTKSCKLKKWAYNGKRLSNRFRHLRQKITPNIRNIGSITTILMK